MSLSHCFEQVKRATEHLFLIVCSIGSVYARLSQAYILVWSSDFGVQEYQGTTPRNRLGSGYVYEGLRLLVYAYGVLTDV